MELLLDEGFLAFISVGCERADADFGGELEELEVEAVDRLEGADHIALQAGPGSPTDAWFPRRHPGRRSLHGSRPPRGGSSVRTHSAFNRGLIPTASLESLPAHLRSSELLQLLSAAKQVSVTPERAYDDDLDDRRTTTPSTSVRS